MAAKWMVAQPIDAPDGPQYQVHGLFDSEPVAVSNRPDKDYAVLPVTVWRYSAVETEDSKPR